MIKQLKNSFFKIKVWLVSLIINNLTQKKYEVQVYRAVARRSTGDTCSPFGKVREHCSLPLGAHFVEEIAKFPQISQKMNS